VGEAQNVLAVAFGVTFQLRKRNVSGIQGKQPQALPGR
jgi:hypothetical protein